MASLAKAVGVLLTDLNPGFKNGEFFPPTRLPVPGISSGIRDVATPPVGLFVRVLGNVEPTGVTTLDNGGAVGRLLLEKGGSTPRGVFAVEVEVPGLEVLVVGPSRVLRGVNGFSVTLLVLGRVDAIAISFAK